MAMTRLLLFAFLFLLSLLVFFRAPTSLLWYVTILVAEFSLVFVLAIGLLLHLWKPASGPYGKSSTILGALTLLVFLLPTFQGFFLSRRAAKEFGAAFPKAAQTSFSFNPFKIFTGFTTMPVAFTTLRYDSTTQLSLDYYKGQGSGLHPCVVVIHGGSWAGGDSKQLPELNSELAKSGYSVASINYRLAPEHHFPAPIEDVAAALRFLKSKAADLSIDIQSFYLLGRSAGGQIALVAGYTLNDPSIKGVIDFYGPADMVWGYQNPTNPLVLNSRKVMEDYLGGTLSQVQKQYDNSSATQLVKSGNPPTLMIYGKHDPLVSHLHGYRLSPILKAAGVPHFELYLPWATHGFDYTLNGPGGQLSTGIVKRFIEATKR
ncbi:MAG: alpha/beta hydrolase [Flaviaesturariibacter sp.]|nr:alpha/beta hydrolase [Flaviaesturariibacter sp.]